METKTSQLRGGIARGTAETAARERRSEGGNEELSGWSLSASEVGAGDRHSQQRPRVTALYIIEAARVISGVLQSRPNQSCQKLRVPPFRA